MNINTNDKLDCAINLLAGWCLAVEQNGASWDDWDSFYKEANYKDIPIRKLIDDKKIELKNKFK